MEIRDASHLVGLEITETTVGLRAELHDPDLQVVAIGPAGENLVRHSVISCNLARAANGYLVHTGEVRVPLAPGVTALPFAEL